MKKLVAAVAATGILFAGTAASKVSAEEYEVQDHDTLWGIAQEYDTTVDSLKDLNNLDSAVIHPGQKIEIDNQEIYIVEKGDTLSGIAADYGVTANDIMEWNDLSDTLITIGQELEIQEVNKAVETGNEGTAAEETESASNEAASSNAEGETISVTATAYTAKCNGCSGVTATGIDLNANPNEKVIAVDPSVIPLGSKVYVEGYGNAIAGDTGGNIKGNKIDIHVPTKAEANNWGVRTVNVTILD